MEVKEIDCVLFLNYRSYTKKLCEISMEPEMNIKNKANYYTRQNIRPIFDKKIRQFVVTERLKARSVRYGFEPSL